MPDTYTVVDATKKKSVDGKFGPMQVVALRLQNGAEVLATEWFTKASTPLPAAGETLEGDVTEGKYGKEFKKAQGFGGRSPRDSRRIERQHSQEMALRALALLGGELQEDDWVDVRHDIKWWTDWFVTDLDVAGGGATAVEDAVDHRSPDPPGAVASSADQPTLDDAMSDKQKAFLGRLVREKGATDDQARLIDWWASENLTGGREGSASKAIDGLTGSSPDEILSRLLEAALAWQKGKTDIPADTEGLEPEGEGKELDDIPF